MSGGVHTFMQSIIFSCIFYHCSGHTQLNLLTLQPMADGPLTFSHTSTLSLDISICSFHSPNAAGLGATLATAKKAGKQQQYVGNIF